METLSAPRLTVRLGSVRRNHRRLVALANARVGASVKANAYGLGIDAIAPALHADGCRDWFVANVDEGVRLRTLLPHDDIYVFNGAMPGTIDRLIDSELTPLLIGLEQIELWAAAARAAERPLRAGLHFDTGMGRTGLTRAEADRLAAAPRLLDGVDVVHVLSHLACADDPGSPHPERQLERFAALRGRFPHGDASLANSAGTLRGPEFHFDVVRPGIALYGGEAVEGDNPMEPTVELHAPILQVDDVEAGDTVGYGATHTIAAAGRHAVVPVGYADGFLRAASNVGSMWIAGHACPIVGRVSMDLTVLDVSGVPEHELRLGAPVEVIGDHRRLDDVAASAGTIGYEILTELGQRYERVHVDDDPQHPDAA